MVITSKLQNGDVIYKFKRPNTSCDECLGRGWITYNTHVVSCPKCNSDGFIKDYVANIWCKLVTTPELHYYNGFEDDFNIDEWFDSKENAVNGVHTEYTLEFNPKFKIGETVYYLDNEIIDYHCSVCENGKIKQYVCSECKGLHTYRDYGYVLRKGVIKGYEFCVIPNHETFYIIDEVYTEENIFFSEEEAEKELEIRNGEYGQNHI